MSDEQQSLLTFPCTFPIKVMAEKHPRIHIELIEIVKIHVSNFNDSLVTGRESKQGNYIAFTLTVDVENKAQLDALYRALTEHEKVKVVL